MKYLSLIHESAKYPGQRKERVQSRSIQLVQKNMSKLPLSQRTNDLWRQADHWLQGVQGQVTTMDLGRENMAHGCIEKTDDFTNTCLGKVTYVDQRKHWNTIRIVSLWQETIHVMSTYQMTWTSLLLSLATSVARVKTVGEFLSKNCTCGCLLGKSWYLPSF